MVADPGEPLMVHKASSYASSHIILTEFHEVGIVHITQYFSWKDSKAHER